MRYIIGVFLFCLVWSCETGIDTIDHSGSVPIVYCILNQDDTIQSVRLTRSYLSTNATEPPSSSDSLLIHGVVNLTIEKVENSTVTSEYQLLPFPISKDSGFYPNDFQLIYQANFKVQLNTLYRLNFEIKDWNYVAYSSFQSLGDFYIVDPAYPEGRKIHLLDDHNPLIHWTRSQNAAVYQVGYQIHYNEMQDSLVKEKNQAVLFTTTFNRDDPGSFYSYTVNSNQFYIRLTQLIPINNKVLRQFISLDAFVIGGSESVGFYLTAQTRQDPFQALDYKNIINGQGIFGSCKTAKMTGFKLDDQSLDSLAYGSYTSQLNFLDSEGHRKN